jgi:hypothetical protein
VILLFLRLAKQPIVNVIDHGPQPAIANPLAVVGRDAGVRVAHDMIDRNLIAGFTGDGLESMA